MILQNFNNCLQNDRIYKPGQIKDVLAIVRTNFRFHCVNTKHKYFNVPAAFDIETTSFYNPGKVGLMYAWTFGLYGLTIIGRTWGEFEKMLEELATILDLGEKKRLIVYVHNLQFDFAFFCSHFNFEKVFAIDRRAPLYALTDMGIEFRCSYLLSGYSLATVGENLLKYRVKKMTGDLNYNMIRHAKTKLTRKELKYIQNDGKVVMAYIAEEIERCEGIANIPYTKTGYVRKYCRNMIWRDPETGKIDRHKKLAYRDIMARLTMSNNLYDQAKNGFSGGFTHANALCVDREIEDVASEDLTSAYPAEMVMNRFPMGEPEKIKCKTMSQKKFYENIDLYCCIFTIHFTNLRPREGAYENYISRHKCIKVKHPEVNNGRIVKAEYVEITITEVDFWIIKQLYDWDSFRVSNFYRFIRGFLPRDFILAILELYKNKTELKGVIDKQAEYQVSKGMLNACYLRHGSYGPSAGNKRIYGSLARA